MKLHRISIQTEGGLNLGLTSYQARRIDLLGAYIETLFFVSGFKKLNINDCNFIYIRLVNTDMKFGVGRYPEGRKDEYEWSMIAYFDASYFYTLAPLEQLKYMFESILEAVEFNFNYYKIDSKIVSIVRCNAKESRYCIGYDSKYLSPNRKFKVVGRYIWLYDLDIHYADLYIKNVLLKEFEVYTMTPLYIPAEHPENINAIDNYIFTSKKTWISDRIFHYKVGGKTFEIDTETLILTVYTDERLDGTYVNSANVHNGADVTIR